MESGILLSAKWRHCIMNKRANKNANQWINTIRRYLRINKIDRSLFQPLKSLTIHWYKDRRACFTYFRFLRRLHRREKELVGRNCERYGKLLLDKTPSLLISTFAPIFTPFFIQVSVFIVAASITTWSHLFEFSYWPSDDLCEMAWNYRFSWFFKRYYCEIFGWQWRFILK